MHRMDVILTLLAAKGPRCAINSFPPGLGWGRGEAHRSRAFMLTGGGVQRAARLGFILKRTVRFFSFIFLLFQRLQQQIYAPNYVWLWLN